MSVTAPAGFRAAGVRAGLKASGRPDLALVVNAGPLDVAAGVFTTNRFAAAPVVWSRGVITGERGRPGAARAVILNAGSAHACPGPGGAADAADAAERRRLLVNIQYESSRAGLNTQVILGLIEVESAFRQYAISGVGARGLMQVMPFWKNYIGKPSHNLFDIRTNLRYGCTILRHYNNIEKGNIVRALARFNGSLGSNKYPNAVLGAWRNRWQWG